MDTLSSSLSLFCDHVHIFSHPKLPIICTGRKRPTIHTPAFITNLPYISILIVCTFNTSASFCVLHNRPVFRQICFCLCIFICIHSMQCSQLSPSLGLEPDVCKNSNSHKRDPLKQERGEHEGLEGCPLPLSSFISPPLTVSFCGNHNFLIWNG